MSLTNVNYVTITITMTLFSSNKSSMRVALKHRKGNNLLKNNIQSVSKRNLKITFFLILSKLSQNIKILVKNYVYK